MNPKAEIKVSALVLPYNKHQPILTYNNPIPGKSLFIRAKQFAQTDLWFAAVNPDGPVAVDVAPGDARAGVIVFVTRPLQPGEAVMIERVFSSGNCAKGSPVKLPADWVCPMEVELSNLFA